MAMNFNTLKVRVFENEILILTLDRPQIRNAINSEMMIELNHFWQEQYVNHEKIRCIILTGTDPSFCAGADLKERKILSLADWQEQHAQLEQAVLAMLDCPIPIIAAVNGHAVGGGLELILACDFAYAANTAIFSQPEVKLGIMPAALGTQLLPRVCGIKRAKELIYTGDTFSAYDAYEWKIINKICEPNELMDEVLSVAKRICENAPLSIQQVKKSINISENVDIKSGYSYELEAYYRLLPTRDRIEGIKAFNEKRKPIFDGE